MRLNDTGLPLHSQRAAARIRIAAIAEREGVSIQEVATAFGVTVRIVRMWRQGRVESVKPVIVARTQEEIEHAAYLAACREFDDADRG